MDGVLIINKPKGFTSHDVVNVLRKALDTKKIGHTGTLDPNATGVLPILIGTATKISKYLIEHDKTYIATVRLGEKTDTGDSEGSIIEKDLNFQNISCKQIRDVLKTFIGKQKQIPPMYSAIKINGKKAYEYARKGQAVQLEPRNIEIYSINLIKLEDEEITFEVSCSKGTYIRTLCEDIAKRLGTIGYMKELTRTRVDEFKLENAVTIDQIKENSLIVNEKIISIESIFMDKPQINLNNRKKELFLNGVRLTFEKPNDIYRIYNNNEFIGLGTIKDNLLKRDVIVLEV
ncbi:MAG: tRNA pseudouridine(55) synthase TruB [Clostridia bacterium]|nr:tRNA pseudouridine(55) synthase TruB [Clostridia bacterium]